MRRVCSWYPPSRHILVTQWRKFCSQSTELIQNQTESATTASSNIDIWDLEVKQQFRILYERAQKVRIKILFYY